MTKHHASILVRDAKDITDAERDACQSLWRRTFAPNRSHVPNPDAMHTPAIYVMLRDEDGSLLGVCHWIARDIVVNGQSHHIAGLGGVAVEGAHRGGGLGAQMVRAAIAAAGERGYDFGVLFCGQARRAFYERLGWRLLQGDITVRRHGIDGPPEAGDLVMALPLSVSAAQGFSTWMDAPIHLGVGQW